MPRTLVLGSLAITPPVVLAPMAGITNRTFRTICRNYGAGLYVSEMTLASSLASARGALRAHLDFGEDEQPRSIQLHGVDPDAVSRAIERLVGEGLVDHVDLNFGCPAPKVTRKGGGAAIPARPLLFARILRAAVRAAGSVPVTTKMRIGLHDALLTHRVAGRVAQEEGCAAVGLHARTAEQRYSGAARWEAIAELVSDLSVPVLGNGDIYTAEDALRMTERTGCAGVIVGRGCLGRPWLFRDLACAFAGEPVPEAPRLGETIDVARRHLAGLVECQGERLGVQGFRKHLAWYFAAYATARARVPGLLRLETTGELVRALAELDPEEPYDHAATRAPRGKADPARRVPLPHDWLSRTDDRPPSDGDSLVSGG